MSHAYFADTFAFKTCGDSVCLQSCELDNFSVARGAVGDQILLLDEAGYTAPGRVIDISSRRTPTILVQLLADPVFYEENAVKVYLVQPFLQGRAHEDSIRMCVEAGVDAISLWTSDRCVVRGMKEPKRAESQSASADKNFINANKYARIKTIIKESCKVAQRPRIPELLNPIWDIEDLCSNRDELLLVFDANKRVNSLTALELGQEERCEAQKIWVLWGLREGFQHER